METDIDEKKVELYADFLCYAWDRSVLGSKYYTAFHMITEQGMTWTDDAIALLEWLENNEMPSNIEQMFNEWILEKRL